MCGPASLRTSASEDLRPEGPGRWGHAGLSDVEERPRERQQRAQRALTAEMPREGPPSAATAVLIGASYFPADWLPLDPITRT